LALLQRWYKYEDGRGKMGEELRKEGRKRGRKGGRERKKSRQTGSNK